MRGTSTTLLLALSLTLATTAFAQTGGTQPVAPGSQTISQPVVRRALQPGDLDLWQDKLAKTDADFKAGDFAGVLRKTGKIQAEMEGAALTQEPRLAALVAKTFLYKALAEAAGGNEYDAVWDLHVAREIDAAIGKVKLNEFGEPGKKLVGFFITEQRLMEKNLVGPETLSQPFQPVAPVDLAVLGRIGGDWKDAIEVQVVVDLDGRFRSPKLVAPVHPLVAISLFNGLRSARYESPKVGDKAVMVPFLFRRDAL